ncbi:hypothetical protein H8F24_09350 [Synechococcus sp. CBW1002]|uniref:hypothetical protein n=1 Tax=Synechococcus sp. CBW1002 TaxID=1353134 RepID=UPI0018CD7E04|nr:hypothetical protein [Synechococcus sp. CBW1002]QPN58452.1 hypothetical protein H8F24_09350 [Synechococcus sp. CBW1002]
MTDHLSPAGMSFVQGIQRPDSAMLLFSQAKRLTDCTEQDVALMVALPVSIAPQELNEAQQELDWPSSLAALETASRSDDARLAVEAIEERLQGDSDELAMVIELGACRA